MIRRKVGNHLFLVNWYLGTLGRQKRSRGSTCLSFRDNQQILVTQAPALPKVAGKSTEDKSGRLSSLFTCFSAQNKEAHGAQHSHGAEYILSWTKQKSQRRHPIKGLLPWHPTDRAVAITHCHLDMPPPNCPSLPPQWG